MRQFRAHTRHKAAGTHPGQIEIWERPMPGGRPQKREPLKHPPQRRHHQPAPAITPEDALLLASGRYQQLYDRALKMNGRMAVVLAAQLEQKGENTLTGKFPLQGFRALLRSITSEGEGLVESVEKNPGELAVVLEIFRRQMNMLNARRHKLKQLEAEYGVGPNGERMPDPQSVHLTNVLWHMGKHEERIEKIE